MDFKSKKGSISIFVLVALLFMASYLIIAYASNVNKTKTQADYLLNEYIVRCTNISIYL